MKKSLFYICVMVLLGSCNESGDISEINLADNPMSFVAQVNGKEDDWSDVAQKTTRGMITSTETIQEFSVFCFYTGWKKWDNTSVEHRIPNKMFNVKVAKNVNTGTWEYAPPLLWGETQGQYFTFMGYSPCTLSSSGIELVTGRDTPGSPKIKFTTSEEVATQTDLLVVNPRKDLNPVSVVKMNLQHALARMNFSVKLKNALNGGAEVTITSVKLKIGELGSFYKTGTLDLFTKTWSDWSEPFSNGEKNLPTPASKPILTTTSTSVIAENGYLLLIPQALAANLFFVEFVASTKTSGGTTTKTYSNIKIPAVTLLPSKSYNYQFEIDADQNIKLEKVDITAWEVKSGGEYDI